MSEFVAPEIKHEFAVTLSNYFSAYSFPIGFSSDAQMLYFASNVGRDKMGVYAIRAGMGTREDLKLEDEIFDLFDFGDTTSTRPIFDPYDNRFMGVCYAGFERETAWVDPDFSALQAKLDAKNPGYSIELLGWDRARERFLVRRSSRSDPGEYTVYQRSDDGVLTRAVRAPAISRLTPARTRPWQFARRDGELLTGTLSLPEAATKASPVVVLYPDSLWRRVSPDFDREVAAFVRMGYAVLDVHYRGTRGRGLAALRAGQEKYDAVAAEDVLAAIDWHARSGVIDPARVAVFGERRGGSLALRAMQLHPGRFAAGVIVDAPMDLEPLVEGQLGVRNPSLDKAAERPFFGSVLRGKSPYYYRKPLGSPVWLVESGSDLFYNYKIEPTFQLMQKRGDDVVYTFGIGEVEPEADPAKRAHFFAEVEAFLKKSFARQPDDSATR